MDTCYSACLGNKDCYSINFRLPNPNYPYGTCELIPTGSTPSYTNETTSYQLINKSPSTYRPCPANAKLLSVDKLSTSTIISFVYPNNNSISLSDKVNCFSDKPKLVSNNIFNNVLHGVCSS